jgi:hypothetical protein
MPSLPRIAPDASRLLCVNDDFEPESGSSVPNLYLYDAASETNSTRSGPIGALPAFAGCFPFLKMLRDAKEEGLPIDECY